MPHDAAASCVGATQAPEAPLTGRRISVAAALRPFRPCDPYRGLSHKLASNRAMASYVSPIFFDSPTPGKGNVRGDGAHVACPSFPSGSARLKPCSMFVTEQGAGAGFQEHCSGASGSWAESEFQTPWAPQPRRGERKFIRQGDAKQTSAHGGRRARCRPDRDGRAGPGSTAVRSSSNSSANTCSSSPTGPMLLSADDLYVRHVKQSPGSRLTAPEWETTGSAEIGLANWCVTFPVRAHGSTVSRKTSFPGRAAKAGR